MKRFISLFLVVVFALTAVLLAGCEGENTTPTEPVTEAPTVSEIDSQYETAQKCMQEGKYADAITAFSKVLELDDSRIDVYLQRGDAYYEFAQTENKEENLLSAVADYETAVSKDTKVEDTKLYKCYVGLGENAVNNDQKNDALTYYEKAYEFDKSDPYVALVQRKYMYYCEGENENKLYVAFDFDDTALACYDGGAVYPDATYTISDNVVQIVFDDGFDNKKKYVWEYKSEEGQFYHNGTKVEKTPAKDVFDDAYPIYSELYSMHWNFQNQYEMTQHATQAYKSWDDLLNVVYDYVIEVLPADKASELSKEQKSWISEKENAMESAASEYTGGSMYGMIKAQTGADYTKERVKELIDMIPEP